MDVRVVLIFVSMLLWKVHSLKCHQCISHGSSECPEEDCPNGQCVNLGMTIYSGSNVSHFNMKSCDRHTVECLSGSMSYGIAATSYTSLCCTTDLCNAAEMPEVPLNTTENGLKCYACKGLNCSSTVNCVGDENRCISTKVSMEGQPMDLDGCASEHLCGLSLSVSLLSISSRCCEGNLCNHGDSNSKSGYSLALGLAILQLALPTIIPTL